MPNLPRRHFLPWDRPLLPQAVALLAGDWQGPDPLDLSDLLVVVPTRQSGRRLREALAGRAADCRSAVFPPRVLTPETLVGAAAGAGLASRLEGLLAWIDVFRDIPLDDFREVFPVDPPARSFAWALGLAEQFQRLQTALHENGLGLSDVVARAGADFAEAARWAQLGELERRQIDRLRQAGLRPAHGRLDRPILPGAPAASAPGQGASATSGPAGQPPWLEGIARIVVLATIDPLPSALTVLAEAAALVPVDVVVFGPGEEASHFDAWGRPIAESWASRILPIPDFERTVHLGADPADEAAMVAALAGRYRAEGEGTGRNGSMESPLAIGVADPDILPLLEAAAGRVQVPVYNPEGRKRESGALYHLLAVLADCVSPPAFETVEALARCPDFLAYLARQFGPEFSTARFLEELDDLRQRHLPSDLSAARLHARGRLADALRRIDELHQALSGGNFAESVAGVLGALFAGRQLDPAVEEDRRLKDAAAAWTGVLRDCAAAAKLFPQLAAADWWELALGIFGDSREPEEKPAGALDLQGWLELLFEEAPHLVAAGLNDGLVPEAVAGDAFLPESLRARLGLKTNAARFARDAYLLRAISACRSTRGRIDLLFARTSAAGDPLRPSRLLLRCADAELPARIAFLFRAPEVTESHLPWRRAWRLRPRVAAPPPKVAVTALRRWLACPFRFHLQSVLGMESLDAAKNEMDALDFGTLCHDALEAMGREPALRDCVDAAMLRDFLLAELSRRLDHRYGSSLPLPLVIQAESARQRLGRLAEVQAKQRAEGWVIERVEWKFSLAIGAMTVTGKIDRIDRHADTGAVRVVDYKTSDTAVNPRTAHLRLLRAGESVPDWAVVTVGGKPRVWVDLQLPIYRERLAGEFGEGIACGYLNLPKAVGDTGLALWDDYAPDLQAAAMRCAGGVCAAISAGEFWPPNEEVEADTDEFAALFHHGAADSVEWTGAMIAAEAARRAAR